MSEILKLIFKFLLSAWSAEKSVSENSILGESRFDRESHRFWGIVILICLVLLLLTTTGVVTWRWWNRENCRSRSLACSRRGRALGIANTPISDVKGRR